VASKKYQVFISSTFRDLVDERQDATKAILDLNQIPSGMELFPAADQEQFDYIKKVIDECDYYVLIIGGRYGSVDAAGISFTEHEYDYAVETKKVVLAFIHEAPEIIPAGNVELDPALRARLEAFRAKVSQGRLVKSWRDRGGLQAVITTSLARAIGQMPGVGWIRGNAAASAELLEEINELRKKDEAQRAEIERLQRELQPHIDDLAGMEDLFPVRYNHQHWHHGYPTEEQTIIELQWQHIFRAIGPELISAQSDGMIKHWLLAYLVENNNVPGVAKILTTDINTIVIHLNAAGLIEVFEARDTSGGSSIIVRLTERGRATLTELLAVRRISAAGAEKSSL
jgi:hypothetical protein